MELVKGKKLVNWSWIKLILYKKMPKLIIKDNRHKSKNLLDKKAFLRISIGIIFIWFGVLKFFPNLSPADSLAKDTIRFITFGLLSSKVSIVLLAFWEVGVGALLISNIYAKAVVNIALLHIVFTFLPFFIFSELCFKEAPFVFTIIGQYIMKNIVIIAALLLIREEKELH